MLRYVFLGSNTIKEGLSNILTFVEATVWNGDLEALGLSKMEALQINFDHVDAAGKELLLFSNVTEKERESIIGNKKKLTGRIEIDVHNKKTVEKEIKRNKKLEKEIKSGDHSIKNLLDLAAKQKMFFKKITSYIDKIIKSIS